MMKWGLLPHPQEPYPLMALIFAPRPSKLQFLAKAIEGGCLSVCTPVAVDRVRRRPAAVPSPLYIPRRPVVVV